MRRERAQNSGGGRGGTTTMLKAGLNRVKMRRGKRDRGDKFITTVTVIMARNKPAGLENRLGAAGFNTTTTNTTIPSGWFTLPLPHLPLLSPSHLSLRSVIHHHHLSISLLSDSPSLLHSPLLSVPVL